MYGAKEIRLDPFFSQEADSVFGLIDENEDETENYNFFKNTLVPRLNGRFGKALRGIKQTEQFANISFSAEYNFINSITFKQLCDIGEQTGQFPYDLGFFEDGTDKNYFMLVRRYYQTDFECTHIIDYDLNTGGGVSQYNNWKLIDYITGATRTKLTSDTIHCVIPAGDAKLFGLIPIIPYGGVLITNDTVKVNTTLTDNMTISNGVNLIINESKIYTVNDTINLQGTGFITGDGYINRGTSGWININSWSYSVFKGKQGYYPKIIWGKYPGAGTVTNYKVYRRVEGGSWTLIKTLSSSARQYIDSTFEIATTGGNNLDVDYRVTAVLQFFGESGYSNTITYKADNPLGKGQLTSGEKFEYYLSENYPNPFNPNTVIRYSVAEVTDVNLIVYDILGREIKVLVNDRKKPGNYEVHFDAEELSSGVYIYRMTTDKYISAKKMILLR